MRLTALSLVTTLFIVGSCVEPEEIELEDKGAQSLHKDSPVGHSNNSGVGVKNYLQLNNTYAQMTGISSTQTDVKNEYEKVYVQLPSTSNPNSISGFNQIATIRLAFAYCDKYIDSKYASIYQASLNSTEQQAKKIIDEFIDIDYDGNTNDKNFLGDVVSILQNEDGIISGGSATVNNQKLLKLSCTSILSSSYVTMI